MGSFSVPYNSTASLFLLFGGYSPLDHRKLLKKFNQNFKFCVTLHYLILYFPARENFLNSSFLIPNSRRLSTAYSFFYGSNSKMGVRRDV